MVIVRLKGGVGNQLFQFAFAMAIALHKKEKLFVDLIYLVINPLNFIARDFKLGRLNNFEIADQDLLMHFNTLNATGNAIIISDNFPKCELISLFNSTSVKAILLDGYFQDEIYFFNYKSLIKKEFKNFIDSYYEDSLNILKNDNQNIVSIHVRRGDYLFTETLKVLGICEYQYYQKAIEIIKSLVIDPYFYIFSDDYEQADLIFSSLLNEKINISAIVDTMDLQNKDLIELSLMSNCKHFILANSSYSWWGAYLSDSLTKKIIAPKKWFADEKLNQLSDDIGLESWIRI